MLSDIAAFAIESGFGFWALVVAGFVGFGGAVVRRGNSRRRRMI